MKFEIGEVAEFGVSGKAGAVGDECEIATIGFDSKGYCGDYGVKTSYRSPDPSGLWCCNESSLRKKKPPEELGSWEELSTIWNPRELVV